MFPFFEIEGHLKQFFRLETCTPAGDVISLETELGGFCAHQRPIGFHKLYGIRIVVINPVCKTYVEVVVVQIGDFQVKTSHFGCAIDLHLIVFV